MTIGARREDKNLAKISLDERTGHHRAAQLEEEIRALRRRLQNREAESLSLDLYLNTDDFQASPAAPVTLSDLEILLTTSMATKHLFQADPEIKDAYLLNWQGSQLPVTFSRSCFDEHPDTVRFLTYGNPLLAQLLEQCPLPQQSESSSIVRCVADGALQVREWYATLQQGGQPQRIVSYGDLRQYLKSEQKKIPTETSLLEQAQALFAIDVDQAVVEQQDILKHRHTAYYLAERAKGQRVLVKAALAEIALGQQPEMFGEETYPAAFATEAVIGLQRHGFPWGALLQLAYDTSLSPSSADPYYEEVRNASRDSLKSRLAQLKDEAKRIVQSLKVARQAVENTDGKSILDLQVEQFAVQQTGF